MLLYVVKRVIAAIPLIFGLLTITFFIIRMAPGDPASLYLQGNVDPGIADRVRRNFGLDDPLPVQYVKWLKAMATGEFGVSFSKHRPVVDILADAIPNTLILTTLALFLNIALGVLIGTLSAVTRGSWVDNITTVLALFVYSIPEFWLALMLILGVSLHLDLLPAAQMHSPNADQLPLIAYLFDLAKHLVLPVFVLGFASAAATGRYMRGSLLDVIGQDYIRTARAKGLPEWKVVGKHAMRNAIIPVITIVGLSLPFLLGGAVVVEAVFDWPGMGNVLLEAIFSRDYPVVIALTAVSGFMVVLGNLLADVLYAIVDPRIRLE